MKIKQIINKIRSTSTTYENIHIVSINCIIHNFYLAIFVIIKQYKTKKLIFDEKFTFKGDENNELKKWSIVINNDGE